MVGSFRTINSALKWRAAILRRRKAALNRHDPLSHATPRGLVCWRDDPAAALAKIDYHCRNQPVSREANVNRGTFFRRHFLKLMAAAGAIGLPAVRPFSPRVSHARGAPAYDPAARFDLVKSSFGATAPAAC